MNVIFLKRKNILKAVMFVTFLFVVGTLTKSFGMQHYYKVDFSTGIVTATKLNVSIYDDVIDEGAVINCTYLNVRSGPRNKL